MVEELSLDKHGIVDAHPNSASLENLSDGFNSFLESANIRGKKLTESHDELNICHTQNIGAVENEDLLLQFWAQRQALQNLSLNVPVPANVASACILTPEEQGCSGNEEASQWQNHSDYKTRHRARTLNLINERKRALDAGIEHNSQAVKLRLLLERKQLGLLKLQCRLRNEMLVEKWTVEDLKPDMLLDWGRMRLARPGATAGDAPLYHPPARPSLPNQGMPSPADVARLRAQDESRRRMLVWQRAHVQKVAAAQEAAQAAELAQRQEEEARRMALDAEERALAEQAALMRDMAEHARELKNQWAALPKRRQQRTAAVRNIHTRERLRAEREAVARVSALKSHNYDEYLRLSRNAKDERLRELLRKTDEVMQTLGSKVQEHRAAAEGGSMAMEEDSDEGEDHAETLIRRQHRYYATVHQIRESVTVPKMLVNGTLRSYQVEGVQFLVSLFNNKMNGILADEMGLGKTVQVVATVAYLLEVKDLKGPHLILAPKATLSNWSREFSKWLPEVLMVVYDGTPDERKAIKAEYIDSGKFNVLVSHYDMAMRDKAVFKKIQWEVLVVDEGHRLKNAESKLFYTLTGFQFKTRLLLTGTPIQNTLSELWALLHFLLPRVFDCIDTFDQWFAAPFKGISEDASLQLNEEEQLLIINRLHQVIRPFMLRRTKMEVEKELPSKTEHVIKCDLSAWQKLLYQQIREKGLNLIGSSGSKPRSLQNLTMHLRKACNHPYLMLEDSYYEPTDPQELISCSGKLVLLDSILPKLRRTGHRVLLFSQMTRALDVLEDFLSMRGYKYLRLDGSTKTDERPRLLEEFNAPDSPYFVFMLSTRAGGLGLNLQTADTVIMFDSDWNPQMDLQAEDRAHRIGQTREVLVLILASAGTVEEVILDRATQKRDIDAKVIQAGMFNDKSSNLERQQALQAILSKDAAQLGGGVTDADQLNRLLARTEEELAVFSAMDEEWRQPEATGCPAALLQELPAWLLEEKQDKVARESPFSAYDESEPDANNASTGGRRTRRSSQAAAAAERPRSSTPMVAAAVAVKGKRGRPPKRRVQATAAGEVIEVFSDSEVEEVQPKRTPPVEVPCNQTLRNPPILPSGTASGADSDVEICSASSPSPQRPLSVSWSSTTSSSQQHDGHEVCGREIDDGTTSNIQEHRQGSGKEAESGVACNALTGLGTCAGEHQDIMDGAKSDYHERHNEQKELDAKQDLNVDYVTISDLHLKTTSHLQVAE